MKLCCTHGRRPETSEIKSSSSLLMYAFVRAPRLKPRLDFVEIAQQTFAREWPGRIRRAFGN